MPLHTSARSQGPLAGRPQSVPEAVNLSSGQLVPPPHSSAGSHGPTLGLHVVSVPRKLSNGHKKLVPLHVSGASHALTAGRHGVPISATTSTGHTVLVPVQVSAASHGVALARHTRVVGATASAGHAVVVGEHTSATSQTLALARQVTVRAVAAESAAHAPLVVPVRAAEHAWQSVAAPPPHALAQQTPSTQKPEAHATPLAQTVPSVPRIVNTRALPASASNVSSRETPTSARLPSDVSATEEPNQSLGAASKARSVGSSDQVVAVRKKARALPASLPPAVPSRSAPMSPRLPSDVSATDKPKRSSAAPSEASSVASSAQLVPLRKKTPALPASVPRVVLS